MMIKKKKEKNGRMCIRVRVCISKHVYDITNKRKKRSQEAGVDSEGKQVEKKCSCSVWSRRPEEHTSMVLLARRQLLSFLLLHRYPKIV